MAMWQYGDTQTYKLFFLNRSFQSCLGWPKIPERPNQSPCPTSQECLCHCAWFFTVLLVFKKDLNQGRDWCRLEALEMLHSCQSCSGLWLLWPSNSLNCHNNVFIYKMKTMIAAHSLVLAVTSQNVCKDLTPNLPSVAKEHYFQLV